MVEGRADLVRARAGARGSRARAWRTESVARAARARDRAASGCSSDRIIGRSSRSSRAAPCITSGSAPSTSILMNRTGRRSSSVVERDDAAPSSSGCPAAARVPSRSRYAPPVFSVSTGNVSVAVPGHRADRGALEDDADRRTRSRRIDRSSRSALASNGSNAWTRPPAPTIAAICIVKNPMCAPASIAVSPGFRMPRTKRTSSFVPAAHDVQADDVVRQIDEQPHAVSSSLMTSVRSLVCA